MVLKEIQKQPSPDAEPIARTLHEEVPPTDEATVRLRTDLLLVQVYHVNCSSFDYYLHLSSS